MASSVTILGLDALDRKLKRMPAVAKERIRKAMAEGADEIVAMMKSLVPVESGELRDSIGWTWGKKPKYAQAIAVAKSKMADELTLTIFVGNARVRYAHLVEFATRAHINQGLFPGTQHPGTKAQPFFFVSWRALKRPVGNKIRRSIRAAARQVAAGG
jgi:HK97 gp10 family phage protein